MAERGAGHPRRDGSMLALMPLVARRGHGNHYREHADEGGADQKGDGQAGEFEHGNLHIKLRHVSYGGARRRFVKPGRAGRPCFAPGREAAGTRRH